MSDFDYEYERLISDIDAIGYNDKDEVVRPHWEDGEPAHTTSLLHRSFTFNPYCVPILTRKKVAWKTAFAEIRWIWQLKSNKLEDAHDLGIQYWDKWGLEDGTIGKAYGYQLGKLIDYTEKKGYRTWYDQVDQLISNLKFNPSSRRIMTEIWVPQDLKGMVLTPCVHLTQWFVQKDQLYLNVRQRSADAFIGLPINVVQYWFLWQMIAQVVNLKPGLMYYDMANVHVYDRHWDKLRQQFHNQEFEDPEFWINPEIKNFYDFGKDDLKLINYRSSDPIRAEVAI